MKNLRAAVPLIVFAVMSACAGSSSEPEPSGDGDGVGDGDGDRGGDGDGDRSGDGDGDGDGDRSGSGDGDGDGDRSGGGDGDGDMGGASGQGLSSDDFCHAYADLGCKWVEECQGRPCDEWIPAQYADRECQDARASAEEGFLTFDEDTARECLEIIDQQVCSGMPPFFRPEIREVCGAVFAGTVTEGDECTSSDSALAFSFDECEDSYCERSGCWGACTAYQTDGQDCDDGQRCHPNLRCNEGKCSPPRGVGESCEGASCQPDLECAGTPRTCRALGAIGDDCVDRWDCAESAGCLEGKCSLNLPPGTDCHGNASCREGDFCRYDSDEETQECAPLLEPGADCADPDYDQCVEGYECTYWEPYQCVVRLGTLDEPCGPSGCDEGLWCDRSEADPGVCRAVAGEEEDCSISTCGQGLFCGPDSKCYPFQQSQGEPCDVFTLSTCAAGLFCDRETDTCQPPRGEGNPCNPFFVRESCEQGHFCACLHDTCPGISSSHNLDDICVPLKEDGQTCSSADECASSYCGGDGACEDSPPPPDNCSR